MATVKHNLCSKNEYEQEDGSEDVVMDIFTTEKFNSAPNYQAQPDDVFIIAFPKCGTTWMQAIVYSLQNQGHSFDDDVNDFMARTPFLELLGAEGMSAMRRPGAIKTHMSFFQVPKHPQAKYIVTIRHPKDVCVSYYHFAYAGGGFSNISTDFDEYLDRFLAGDLVWWGSYFDSLRAFWPHRNDENVLLVSYEQMKANLTDIIRKVAHFLDVELDGELLNKVMRCSSFEYMRQHYDKTLKSFYTQPDTEIDQRIGTPFANLKKRADKLKEFHPNPNLTYVREGKVGSWKSCMTNEQSCRLDHAIEQATRGLDGIQSFWDL